MGKTHTAHDKLAEQKIGSDKSSPFTNEMKMLFETNYIHICMENKTRNWEKIFILLSL